MATTLSPCPNCSGVNRIDLATASASKPICGRCQTALRLDGAVTSLTAAGLDKLVRQAKRPVAVDFWAEWCGPCKMFAPVFSAVAIELAEEIVFAKLDTEAEAPAAQRHNIRSIPTLVLFKDGAESKRQAGALSPDALRAWLRA